MAVKIAAPIVIMTGYYRVSTKAESQRTSFENQPAYFNTLLKEPRFSNRVRSEKFYCDYGTSGTKLDRPGFVEMLLDAGLDVEIEDRADIPHPKYPDKFFKQRIYHVSVNPKKKPKFNEIWVKTTSRFARNINAYEILQVLRLAKVYVYFIDIDLSTRDEDSMPAIRKKLDEDMAYSEQVSRNKRIAQKQYELENRVSSPLYGYVYHRRTKSRLPFYTIHPEESLVVKRIYALCIQGLGAKAISKTLANEGLFTNQGKPFATSTIQRILKNEKYKGLNVVSKYTTGQVFEKLPSAKILDDYKDRLKPTEDLPAIISDEDWEKAQQAFSSRRIVPTNPSSVGLHIPSHPFKDLLICGSCGAHFVYDNNRGRGFFKCATKASKGYTVCNCVNLFVYKLEEFLNNLQSEGLYSLIETDYEMTTITLIALIEGYLEKYKNPTIIDANNTEYQEIQARITSHQKTRDSLLETLASSTFSEDTFKAFRQTIESIDEQIKDLTSKVSDLSSTPSDIAQKLTLLFDIIFKEFAAFEGRKKKYTREEVLSKLSQIKVYGKTVNNSGGRPPLTVLVPVLKLTEQAQGLVDAGYQNFQYRLKDTLPTYDAEALIDGKLNPVDDDSIPAYKKADAYTQMPKGKSQWPKSSSKYLYAGSAFYRPDGSLGYITDLGLKQESALHQIKEYAQKLLEDFEATKALYTTH